MDGFPTLSIEIVRLILIEAVRVRGVKRAARLRLVSRSWNREVTEAILQSGILDGLDNLFSSSFWPQYITNRTFRKEPLSRSFRIIRQVAERVLVFRGESISDDALRQYVLDICQSFPSHMGLSSIINPRLEAPAEQRKAGMEIIEDSDEDFKGTLLAAAACTNDIALVKHLLPAMQDCLYLIAQDGSHDEHCPILGYPLDIAAFKGNAEVMRMLLEVLKDIDHLEPARDLAAGFAGEGNQMVTLELCLDPVYTGHNQFVLAAAEDTTSTEIFDRVLQLCKDHLIDDARLALHPRPDKLLGEFLSKRLTSAVACGQLAMVRHLLQLGVKPCDIRTGDEDYGYYGLINRAASRGHTSVIACLLENGVTITSRSLEAASRHGNPSCVKILLEHGAIDSFKPGSALLESIKRENELVLRQLIESGMRMNESLKEQALYITEKEGLLSMSKIIQEYR
ncbi:hypothetical protein G7Y89_g15858 [Cudoniella acicularis]|uniref:Ankyrin n=1 Tax=Cudoniella acicularis TaxID=354080 RepID=A0A8H4QEK9_9HELO|nr:hypothetical protein G7Y89_g15858 [Cudoniella acicularis]